MTCVMTTLTPLVTNILGLKGIPFTFEENFYFRLLTCYSYTKLKGNDTSKNQKVTTIC